MTEAIYAHMAQVTPPLSALGDAMTHLRDSTRVAKRRPFKEPTSNYGSLLERALKNARNSPAADIAAHLLPVHSSLPWVYHYPPRSADEDLRDRIAFAELIGPDGPMKAPNCRVGFTVIAEQTTYPMHLHPAVELYLLITGFSKWQTLTSERWVAPGEFVLHNSNESHAMRTSEEPLLALWSWSGAIDVAASYT